MSEFQNSIPMECMKLETKLRDKVDTHKQKESELSNYVFREQLCGAKWYSYAINHSEGVYWV